MRRTSNDNDTAIRLEEVTRSARALGVLTTATVDAFYVKDRNGRFLVLNDLAAKVLGSRPGEAIGKLDQDMFAPEVWRRLRQDDLAIMASGEPRTFEEEVAAHGVATTWLTTKAPFRDASGEVAGIVGLSRDITARKRAEEALAETNRLLELVIEGIPDAVFIKDRAGRIVLINSGAARMLGKRPDEMVGHDDRSWLPPETARRIMEDDRRIMAAGETVTYEEVVGEGEAERFLSTTKGVRRDAEGRVVGIFGIARDVTASRRAEEALKEAARRKDEFMAMLGHELRNPLAPILTATHVLKLLGSPDPRAEKARDMIERQVMHLQRIVDDLLEASRIARGKIPLHRETIDWVGLVLATVEDHRIEVAARGIRLAVAVPDEPVWVHADPTRLAQVLSNLLGNARKFTDSDGRISVELEVQEGHRAATLAVSDTGVGMTPETLARLFEPFAQAATDLARSPGGLGLGLALVKGLVDLHGGRVEAQSGGRGRGARFTVTLPLVAAPAQPGAQMAGAARQRRLQILVIEDNVDAAESLRQCLELLGHSVDTALDGAAGLRKAAERRPDIVVCDIGLPGALDGYAVARAIRADPALSSARLITVTGYGRDEDRRRALEAGFDAHVVKPVDPCRLEEILAPAPAER